MATTVTLLDPAGREYRSSSPKEINTLVYSMGYRLAEDGVSLSDAIARLSGEQAVEAAAPVVRPRPAPRPEPKTE